ncbi:UDP-2,4-diacetamido-2,4,6-trideoxy-beta-L-altropyranose hydrolase [Rhizorhapis suberifaciens]|uniref:UDP-2,4-diacetamido-2,4, 6-trideoxy-beta-L-altropyranose hydrolase n=1 Tax=Rhizorhapis suberifaciens TaxID=13656 RepID=A0A840HQE2_9SPHN|nr:UDP-2,4-diacetamido-2,4,6-trideoxy-beta-L-altropyranose hydrolase [Rhizorhapis suberifaciens]MBB4640083.1 UDP-2,4-diacetamido-2,4,6-trideoxy-beta-L-altropyranose hydrolase [Rhizorhapis suberifaciens]
MTDVNQGRVVFRVDGSVQIGTGHVMRCLTLADALLRRGVKSLFLCRNIENGLAEWIEGAGHQLIRLPTDGPPASPQQRYGEWLGTTQEYDAETVLSVLRRSNEPLPVAIVVDHYGLDYIWEVMVDAHPKAPILAIDDLNRRHHCEFLLDTTFGKQPAAYESLVPAECHIMVGSDFALLRPDFARMRSTVLDCRDQAFGTGSPVQNLLVSMGGADPHDATGLVLDALGPLLKEYDFQIHALIGPAYPNNDKLDGRVKNLTDRVVVHRSVRDVAELLGRMDLCIGAAGTSSWERCCLGLPTVNVVLAENQRVVAAELLSEGAVVDGGDLSRGRSPWDAHVRTQLSDSTLLLLKDLDRRRTISEAARRVTDGLGSQRVIRAMLSAIVKRHAIHLRPAIWDDAPIIFDWQCYPDTRRYAVNPAAPSWNEHETWIRGKLANKSSSFYIPSVGQIPCGMVRLDRTDAPVPPNADGRQIREVSILTAPEFYGCGVARQALQELQTLHSDEIIVAHVLPGNAASHALFKKANFEPYHAEFYAWYGLRESRNKDAR